MSAVRARFGTAAAAQRGALLIEVLVAILICAFGLLGFAGMQARATSSEFEGFQRSQALVLIEDMVSRMNANRTHAAEYVAAGLIGDGPLEDCAGLAGAEQAGAHVVAGVGAVGVDAADHVFDEHQRLAALERLEFGRRRACLHAGEAEQAEGADQDRDQHLDQQRAALRGEAAAGA